MDSLNEGGAKMSVITISRQYGSGGDEIAAQVCEQLGYKYFDKQLMSKIASEVSLAEVQMSDISEDTYKGRNFLERLLVPSSRVKTAEIRSWTRDTGGGRSVLVETLDEEATINLVQATVEAVYKLDNIVIVGRGGQAILQKKPGVLHVRIEAPQEKRLANIQRQEELNEAEARDLIDEKDKAADTYLRRFHTINWNNPLLYHLVINTGKLESAAAAQLICETVKYLEPIQSLP
jgi:CMP/dCMP kinase